MDERSNELAGVHEGQILAGKYRVERVLGVGGMGVVVAARHIELDNRVALKFLLPALLSNREAVERFAREARNAVRIQNEHVARVSDVGTLENAAPYMVMEFLEGEDLSKWLAQRGPLPVEQAVDFVLQACVAVADAHGLRIVHRDLKPANLFCARRSDGQFIIKVLDFGISKVIDPARASEPPGMWATKTAAVMGSPYYMSPEQVQSAKDVDTPTDIWALGVILFQLLTGTVPFLGDTFGEIAVKIAVRDPPLIRGLRADVPAGLEAVIRRCLEKATQRRYSNVAELAIALLPFAPKRASATVERISGIIQAAGLSASAPAVPPSPGARQETFFAPVAPGSVSPWSETPGVASGRRRAIWGAAVVAISLGVGTVALWLGHSHGAASSGSVAPVTPLPVTTILDAGSANESQLPTLEPLTDLPPAVVPPSPPAATQTSPPPQPQPPRPMATHLPPSGHPPLHLSVPTVPNAPPAMTPSKPNCDPPFNLDSKGQKHFKPECYR